MAWTRSREPVLAKIRLTWVLTVASLTNKARAISRLDAPAAMSRSTSASRGVRSSPPGEAPGGPKTGPRPGTGAPGTLGRARRPGCPRRAGRGREQPLLDAGIEDRLAGRGGQHRTADLRPGRILGQVAEGAGLQRPDDRVVVRVRGEHDDARPGVLGGDAARGADPVAAGHVQVHEHDLGLHLRDQVSRGVPVRRLTRHDDAGESAEQQDQALADRGVVVGDDHRDRLGRVPGAHAGILRPTRHSPSAGPAVSVPPPSAARSRRPVSPYCAPVAASGPPARAGSGLATRTPLSPGEKSRLSRTGWPGACLRALVSASCAVRYAARAGSAATGRGVPVTVTSTATSPSARYSPASAAS